MAEYIEREAAIAYIREQSEEQQKAFEEAGGESGIYADAYNDLAEDFQRIHAADVAPVVRCKDCRCFERQGEYNGGISYGYCYHWDYEQGGPPNMVDGNDFCSYGERKEGENDT